MRLSLALAIAALLAVPGAAQAQPCGCTIKWANYFRTHPYMQTVFEVRLSAQGVNERKAKRVTKRIKAYGRNRGFIPGELCNSPARAKACEAVIACTASAGLTYQTARAAGASRREAAWGALGACEAAVVGVYSRP